jgi:Na+/H+-dicarboxylate symporter
VKKVKMVWKVLIAIVLAILVGSLVGKTETIFGIPYFQIFGLLGDLFLNALTLLVVPLVASSVIHGIGQMGADSSFGRLGMKTLFFYVSTTLLAILVGVIMVNLIQPGTVLHEKGFQMEAQAGGSADQSVRPEHQSGFELLSQLLYKVIPVNIFAAASQGNMLGIIFFSIIFGICLARYQSTAGTTLLNFWIGLFNVLMRMVHVVMRAMPIGVFFLVAKVVASEGLESISSLALFFVTVIAALLIYVLVILPIFLRLKGVSPSRHLRAVAPALITAFSTSSSSATLPITMDCVEKRAGVSNRICSFVIPLGTSVNLSGSALYESVAALFIAQAYGIDMSIFQQVIVIILALLTSMGMAGIPSASIVAIIIILNTMGLPASAVALIIPVDRILDMCRTTVNVFSDTACAVLVARSEGEKVLQAAPLIKSKPNKS